MTAEQRMVERALVAANETPWDASDGFHREGDIKLGPCGDEPRHAALAVVAHLKEEPVFDVAFRSVGYLQVHRRALIAELTAIIRGAYEEEEGQ